MNFIASSFLFASSLVLLGCIGCSSSSNGGSGDNGGPICSKGAFQLNGTIGSSTEGIGGSPVGYIFENALSSNSPGNLDVGFGATETCGPDAGGSIFGCTTGHLHLQWSTLVADNQSVAATGTLVLPDQPNTTYCIDAATVTPRQQTEGGGGTSFVITSFGTGACPGTSASGSATGCAAP